MEKAIALEGVELFGILPPDHMASIASIATEVQLPPGRQLVDGSKPIDALYVVLEGAVELASEGKAPDTLGHNAVLGAWALFDEEPIPLTARALQDTHLLRIGREDFHDLLADNSDITLAMFSMFVKRFRKLVEAD